MLVDLTNIEWFSICVVSRDRPESTTTELVHSVSVTVISATAPV
jgi:hypothetical protein